MVPSRILIRRIPRTLRDFVSSYNASITAKSPRPPQTERPTRRLFEAPVGVELGALPVPEACTPEPAEEPPLLAEEPEPEGPPAANDISSLLGVMGHEKTHCQLV